jgi:hypothetical protein
VRLRFVWPRRYRKHPGKADKFRSSLNFERQPSGSFLERTAAQHLISNDTGKAYCFGANFALVLLTDSQKIVVYRRSTFRKIEAD